MMTHVEILRQASQFLYNLVATVPVCEGSVRRFELGREDHIELRFSTSERIDFRVGDICHLEGHGTFCLTEQCFPTLDTATAGIGYTLRLNADYKLWKNHLFCLTYGNRRTESEWKLTDTLEGHVRELLRNVILLDFRKVTAVQEYNPVVRRVIGVPWSQADVVVDADISSKGAKLIEYQNTDMLSALDKMAETYGCEWWYDAEDRKLHFGTLIEDASATPYDLWEANTAVISGVDGNVEAMTRSESQGTYANRLVVLGGTQNVPENYRKQFVIYPTQIRLVQPAGSEQVYEVIDAIRPLHPEYFLDGTGRELKSTETDALSFLSSGGTTLSEFARPAGKNYYLAQYWVYVDLGQAITVSYDILPKLFLSGVCFDAGINIMANYQVRAWFDDAPGEEPDAGAGGGAPMTLGERFSGEYTLTDILNKTGRRMGMRIDVFLSADRLGDQPAPSSVELSGQITLSLAYEQVVINEATRLTLCKILAGGSTQTVETPFSVLTQRNGVTETTAIILPRNLSLDATNPSAYYITFQASAINEPKIPTAYYSGDPSARAARGIAERRLQIPSGSGTVQTSDGTATYYYADGCLQVEENPLERGVVEEVEVIDDVFPRQTGAGGEYFMVGNLERRMEKRDVEFSDGSRLTEEIPVYRFRNADTSAVFDDDWLIEGEKLEVRFQTGMLSGMAFQVAFNPDALPKMLVDGSGYRYNPAAQVFEIVINDTYGRELPDDVLRPENGDRYLLTGFSPKAMGAMGLVDAAEQELLQKGADALQRRLLDGSTYECTMMTKDVLRLKAFIDADGKEFMTADAEKFLTADIDISSADLPKAGRRVRLWNMALGLEGQEQQRVIGYEHPLDIPYDHPRLIVGQTPQKSRLRAIEKKLKI